MKETRFKQTEIGLVPEEWRVVRLGEIGEPKMCKRIMKWQTSEVGNIPFYKIGTFGNTPDAFISRELFEDYKSRYSYPRKGDLLISAAGTIGRVVVYDGENAYYQDSNIVWIDNREEKALNAFLHYAYSNVEWETNTGTIPRLYNDNLKSIHIPLPPLSEQSRIAGALSSVDGLLSSLSRLIEKKRALRTAAMQQLLTAKTRLPGFDEPWKEVRLGEVCTMYAGGTPSTKDAKNYGGIYSWVSISDISVAGKYIERTKETLTEQGLVSSSAKLYPANTLLFAMYASIGKCCIARHPVTSSQAILGIYNFRNLDIDYLYYGLSYRQSEFANMGQTGTQSNLSKEIVSSIVFLLPSLPEQRAIAAVLSSMDSELSSLEAKRSKVEALRTGMMQELLTGRIRLTEEAAERKPKTIGKGPSYGCAKMISVPYMRKTNSQWQ